MPLKPHAFDCGLLKADLWRESVPSACKVRGLRLKREIGRWLIKSGVRVHLGIVSNNSNVMVVNTKCVVLALF